MSFTKIAASFVLFSVLSANAGGFSWEGKRVAFLGDSITDIRHIGCSSNYWNFLERDLKIVPLVYGINGQQFSGVINQARTLKRDYPKGVEAIFIFAGTNDYNDDIPLGVWFDIKDVTVRRGGQNVNLKKREFSRNVATLRGRINVTLAFLKESFPDSLIYVMTPIHRGYAKFGDTNEQLDESYSNKIGLFIDDYVAAIKEAGNVWAVNIIDLNAESGLFPYYKSHSAFFSNRDFDMLHPNNAGHERIAWAIKNHIVR